jgi:hypothetical protein
VIGGDLDFAGRKIFDHAAKHRVDICQVA